MKRNLTLLTILGALVAVALPASAMATATVIPPSHKFEISGVSASMPKITGSLAGTCTVTKLTGSVPASPGNTDPVAVNLPLAAPTASCGSGVSITVGAGEWKLGLTGYYVAGLYVPANGFTLRYTSLPGCKLSADGTTTPVTFGYWHNGVSTSHSAYSGGGKIAATWANDGASCATAGKKESLNYETSPESLAAVNDTTNPSTLIQVFGGI
jgi:hypothetical protein